MLIQTEQTPNPATLKFLPGKDVMGSADVVDFKTTEDASASVLAERIFNIDGVVSVFYGSDFVSVTKSDDLEWEHLKVRIMAAIMEALTLGQPLFREGREPNTSAQTSEDDDELVVQIKELLETRVRPMVAQDGGDIIFERFEQGIVYLKMRGACDGCPSSMMTLKGGIENMLRHYVPEVLEVRAA